MGLQRTLEERFLRREYCLFRWRKIADLFKQPLVAGLFGALLTGILSVQKQKNFDSETSWYGNALAEMQSLKK